MKLAPGPPAGLLKDNCNGSEHQFYVDRLHGLDVGEVVVGSMAGTKYV